MIRRRAALSLVSIALALVVVPPVRAAAGAGPDPECEALWREGRLAPPDVAERCAGELRRLALEYRPVLEALALRYPGDMVWLPSEERIARMTPVELLALRARGDALERILPERERLENAILAGGAADALEEALARYRHVLRAELFLDMATAARPADGIEHFRARHAAARSGRTPLADAIDEVAREARERLEASEREKFDPTLRGFVWLARMPDGSRDERPPDDDAPPLGDPVAFGAPPDIVFPVPGDGGVCPVGPGPRDDLARGPDDDAPPGEEEPPLGDGFTLGEPPDIVFPVPGDGGVCPVGPGPRDDLARGPDDDAPPGEGEPPLGDGFTLGEPPDIVFPVPGDGGVCPLEPQDDALPPPIDLVTAGFGLQDGMITDAARDPRIQIVIATFPSLRVANGAGVTDDAGQVPGGGLSGAKWDPELRIYVTSAGHLGPGAVDVRIVGSEPATIAGETLVLEPVTLTRDVRDRLLADLRGSRDEEPVEAKGDAYCVELRREPPEEGTFLRVAHPEIQHEYREQRRVVAAADRVREAGRLVPDSEPESYFHSILQWSIWSLAEGFDEARFEDAFIDHTKRNFQESDQPWTEEIERAVRGLAPQRWRDIEKVLEELSEEDNQSKGGAS